MLDEARQYILDIDGQVVKNNPKPKLLGITLDEKLKFEYHIDLVEQKALRSLNSLRSEGDRNY